MALPLDFPRSPPRRALAQGISRAEPLASWTKRPPNGITKSRISTSTLSGSDFRPKRSNKFNFRRIAGANFGLNGFSSRVGGASFGLGLAYRRGGSTRRPADRSIRRSAASRHPSPSPGFDWLWTDKQSALERRRPMCRFAGSVQPSRSDASDTAGQATNSLEWTAVTAAKSTRPRRARFGLQVPVHFRSLAFHF